MLLSIDNWVCFAKCKLFELPSQPFFFGGGVVGENLSINIADLSKREKEKFVYCPPWLGLTLSCLFASPFLNMFCLLICFDCFSFQRCPCREINNHLSVAGVL